MCYKLKTVKTNKKPEKREKPEKQPADQKPSDIAHWYKPLGTAVKQSKSRELRASVLYVNCDCEKRNGLQDDCQRMECHGSPECLTQPPTCGPSAFASGKHLEMKRQRGEERKNQQLLLQQQQQEQQGNVKSGGGVSSSGGDGGVVQGSIQGGGEEVQYCCFPLCSVVGNCDAVVGAR